MGVDQPGGFIEEGRRLFAERDRIERRGRIRQFVFGSLDGLLVPLGVISGVAGGTANSKAVIVAGIAEAFAGALSMGVGEFISGRSEAQVHRTEVGKELEEMKRAPTYELHEMAQLFRHEGVSKDDADSMATVLSRHPRSYAKTMVEKELGISVEPETVKVREALTMGLSYVIASVFPLLSYFFLPVPRALPVSLVLTLIALIVIGIVKGKLATINIAHSVIEIVVVGSISAGGGYFLGSTIPQLLGY
jgi:VIT1/CCC1 family predicted Fe2+/Mn2+ transporter